MPVVTIAVPQFRPRKGDLEGNLDRIVELIVESAGLEPPAQLVVFAETVTSGYFVEGGVRELALSLSELVSAVGDRYRGHGPAIDAIIGFYESWNGTLHNSVAYITLGGGDGARLVHVHRKNFLPTYGLFDEERFVERGYGIRAFDTSWGRAAMLVCEDAWHSLSGTIAALDGAQAVFVVAAAPARGPAPRGDAVPGPASVERWERLIRDIAEEHGVFCVLSNLVGSEGGRMFQGGSLVAGPRGDVRARAPVFEEAMLTATLELDDLARARADLPMLSDLKSTLPFLRTELDRAMGIATPVAEGDASDDTVANLSAERSASATKAERVRRPSISRPRTTASTPLPLVAPASDSLGKPPSLDINPRLVEQWLVSFVRDEFARRGFTKAVIGISGGVDSAVSATLAVRALGAENVIGVRLPYRTSSADSMEHAQTLIESLGIESRTVDISGAVDGYLAHEPDADGARCGNVMARTRMIALFDLSAKYRALPLGTGNKTERLLGYFTWHADDSPPVNPLGDLFKTQVWALAVHLGVPREIIEKPASADLIAGQTDEGDFGVSYAVADEVLSWILHGWSPAEMIARGMDAAAIALVKRRLDATHWKRKLPTVAMLSGAAIGESYLRPVDY